MVKNAIKNAFAYLFPLKKAVLCETKVVHRTREEATQAPTSAMKQLF